MKWIISKALRLPNGDTYWTPMIAVRTKNVIEVLDMALSNTPHPVQAELVKDSDLNVIDDEDKRKRPGFVLKTIVVSSLAWLHENEHLFK